MADKRTRYARLRKMLIGEDKIITINDLRSLIMINIGSDERTITACLKTMGATGLIKDIGDCRFEICQFESYTPERAVRKAWKPEIKEEKTVESIIGEACP